MRERTKRLRLIPAVHRATHRVGLYLQAWRPRLRATQGEAHILAQLASDAPCTIGRLHAAFAHRRSTLTSILDRLAGRKLIERAVRPEDRRSFLVSLTPQGRILAQRVHAALAALEAEVIGRTQRGDLAGFDTVAKALEERAVHPLPAAAKPRKRAG